MAAFNTDFELGIFNKNGHASFCMRCLSGLPATMAEADSSRVAIGFYCLGALDILGLLDKKLSEGDSKAWRSWIWAQQVKRPGVRRPANAGPSEHQYINENLREEDGHIGGFRPGPFVHVGPESGTQVTGSVAAEADPPHLIMTYTSLLALAILRDDFTQLDRQGLINLLRTTQRSDGSFSAFPGQGEADIRMVYTAFAISAMLDDWSGVDVLRAIDFAKRCISYEGGFGQAPGNEAQGGSTYCALATLALSPPAYHSRATLTPLERRRAERWLVQQQKPRRVYPREYLVEDDEDEFVALTLNGIRKDENKDEGEGKDERRKIRTEIVEEGGGFAGRTEKLEDACYSFWCGAALRILCSGAVDGSPPPPQSALHSSQSQSSTSEGPEESQRKTTKLSTDLDLDLDLDERFDQLRQSEETGFVDRLTHARFLSRCQFRLGGLSKAPDAHPDPYHTYLSLAALTLYPPYPSESGSEHAKVKVSEDTKTRDDKVRQSWTLEKLDPLINATVETARWAREKISGKG